MLNFWQIIGLLLMGISLIYGYFLSKSSKLDLTDESVKIFENTETIFIIPFFIIGLIINFAPYSAMFIKDLPAYVIKPNILHPLLASLFFFAASRRMRHQYLLIYNTNIQQFNGNNLIFKIDLKSISEISWYYRQTYKTYMIEINSSERSHDGSTKEKHYEIDKNFTSPRSAYWSVYEALSESVKKVNNKVIIKEVWK
jgi:hypothetical protein